MSYYMAKQIAIPYGDAIAKVKEALKAEGFGVLTEIDVQATLKQKLGVEFRPYVILGVCNPPFAHKALLAEDKIGTMLPCNVVVQQVSDARTEVAAINPLASMAAIGNPALTEIAAEIRAKLLRVIANL